MKPSTTLFLIVALAIGAFAPSLPYPFLFDDVPLVAMDPRLDAPPDWRAILWTPLWPSQFPPAPAWRPAFHLSLALNNWTFGAEPFGFRLVNVLLHALVTALFWRLCKQIGSSPRIAALAAILFALHPVHTEAVVGIVGRAELLMSTGFLLTLMWGLKALQTQKTRDLLLAMLAYALAMFSKEQGFFALAILPLVYGATWYFGDVSKKSSPNIKRFCLVMTCLGCVALVGISLRLQLFGLNQGFGPQNVSMLDNPLVGVESQWEKTGTALRLFGRSLGLLVAPVSLSPDYSHPGITIGWHPVFSTLAGALLALLPLLALLLWTQTTPNRRRNGLAALGIAWFLVTALPTSNLFVLNGSIFAERWLYLPSIGVCLSLAVGIDRSLMWFRHVLPAPMKRTSSKILVSILALLLLLSWNWSAQKPWRSERTLFEQALRVVPHSAKAHYGLSVTLHREGQTDRAWLEISKAVGLWPGYAKAWHQLGVLAVERDELQTAKTAFQTALELNPRLGETHNALGNVFALEGNFQKALLHFQRYQRLGPIDPHGLSRKIQHTQQQLL